MDADVTRGMALAASFFALSTFAAAFSAGGDVLMIALGFLLAAAAMDLFRCARSAE